MMRIYRSRKNFAATALTVLLVPTLAAAADVEQPAHHEAASLPVSHDPSVAAPAASGVLKPLQIGNSGVTLQFGGFAKVDLLQDFDPIGNDGQFKVNSIPVSTDPASDQGGSTNIQARQTRLSLDVRNETPAGLVRAYVEGDFFGSGNSFRMRHGYGEWGGFLGGQTWTTFQDISARPFTIDYEGPDAEVFVRQAMLRYTGKLSEGIEWAIAVEDPDSDLSVSPGNSGGGRSNVPDVPARVTFTQPWGHVQVGGILRQLRYVSDDGSDKETATGWGVNLSSVANLGPRDSIMGHVVAGSGIGRYIESFGGTGSDALLTATGDLETLDAWGAVAGFTHHWSDHYNSTIAAGYAELDNETGQAGSAIKSATSVHFNLIYTPVSQVMFGGELMWGERENFNGDDGDAWRLQVSAQYKFN